MDKYIGFDVSDKNTVACVFTTRPKKRRFETISTDLNDMQKYIRKEKKGGHKLHLTFEVGPRAGHMYDALVDEVSTLNVGNPSEMPWIYRSSKKNDKVDAEKQAILNSIGEIPCVHMPSKEVRDWRKIITHRRSLVCQSTKLKNGIMSLFKQYFLPIWTGGSTRWTEAHYRWLDTITDSRSEVWQIAMGDALDSLFLIRQKLRDVTLYLDSILQEKSDAHLLMTIPGIGPRTAEALLAYTDDITRFKNARSYASYFGVTPKLDESGNTRRLGHINKKGPSIVRWLMGECAWRMVKASPGLKRYHEQVMHGLPTRKKIANVALIRKMLTVIRAMLLTGEVFDERYFEKTKKVKQK